jgi:hypothetical protein
MSRLGGVALTSPSLHTERISEYKLNYLLFQILDSDHIPSYTSAGSVLQLCKVSQKSNKPFRRSCTYKVHDPPFRQSISWIISPSKLYNELNSWNFFIKNNRPKTTKIWSGVLKMFRYFYTPCKQSLGGI